MAVAVKLLQCSVHSGHPFVVRIAAFQAAAPFCCFCVYAKEKFWGINLVLPCMYSRQFLGGSNLGKVRHNPKTKDLVNKHTASYPVFITREKKKGFAVVRRQAFPLSGH